MNNGSKLLLLAVSILLTCALIATALMFKNSGDQLSSAFNKKSVTVEQKIAEQSKTRYDGTIVSGADVINAIRGSEDGITIKVVKKISAEDETAVVEKEFLDETSFVNLPSNSFYINPYAKFLGKITRNANGVINSITFEQQAYVNDAVAQEGGNNAFDGGDNNEGNFVTDMEEKLAALTECVTQLTNTTESLAQIIANGGVNGGGGNNGGQNNDNVLAQINNNLVTINSNFVTINESLKQLESNDESITQKIDAITLALSELSDKIESSDTGDGNNDGSYNTMDITGITSKLTELETQLGLLDDKLNAIIGDNPEGGEVTSIQTLLDAIKVLQDQIDGLKNILSGEGD